MGSRMALLPRLTLAALASGAVAGLLTILAVYCAVPLVLGGWAIEGVGASTLLGGLAAGAVAGLVLAAPPALLAGGAMWALGRRFEAARRAPAWAAAGSAAGALVWTTIAAAMRDRFGEPGLDRPDGALLAALLVGAGAALAFRAVAGTDRTALRPPISG